MSSATRRAPYGSSLTVNEFNARKFSGGVVGTETDHKVDIVPDKSWTGRYVNILVLGGTVGTDMMHFAFSKFPTAEVDRTVAATAAGASTLVGGAVVSGQNQDFQLPFFGPDAPLYFVRESTAVGVHCIITLLDDPSITPYQ